MMGDVPTIVYREGIPRVVGHGMRSTEGRVLSAEEEGFTSELWATIRHRDALAAARAIDPSGARPVRLDQLAARLGWEEGTAQRIVAELRAAGRWPWPRAVASSNLTLRRPAGRHGGGRAGRLRRGLHAQDHPAAPGAGGVALAPDAAGAAEEVSGLNGGRGSP
jgi:hypothetical protein